MFFFIRQVSEYVNKIRFSVFQTSAYEELPLLIIVIHSATSGHTASSFGR